MADCRLESFFVPARAKTVPTSCPVQPDRALAAAVSKRVGQARYGLWFQGHARFVRLGYEVAVAVRNQQSQDWLEGTFGAAVREAVAEVCGPGTAVKWVVDADLFSEEGERGEGRGVREEQPHPVPPMPVAPTPTRTKSGDPTPTRPSPLAPRPSQKDLFGDPLPAPKSKAKRPDPEAAALERPIASAKTARRWKL